MAGGQTCREDLAEFAPDGVTDVPGRGLMRGVESETRDRRDAVVDAAVARGLLVLGCGYRTRRVLTPLDVTSREIDLGVGLLCEAVDETAA